MSIVIQHEAISPFYLEHDYNGFSLFDSRMKSSKSIMKSPDAGQLIQEIVKIKISELEGTFTFEEFENKCKELHENTVSCLKKQEKEVVEPVGSVVNER
tara:strand:- start:29735 stop:30031 length:297 start_codon:yes stop_codon:yes gene_type:complete